MKEFIQNFLKKIGKQIKPYPDGDLSRRLKLINYYKIDVLFDIGANAGQYSQHMREVGFNKKIISFEPLKQAFAKLKKVSENDHNWEVHNYAIGNEDTKSFINVAGNSYSSSILNMLPAHLNSAPESKYVNQEEIEIKKIDSIFSAFCKNGENVMLKIDTQGFEKNVLDGALDSLPKIKIIQLEMSIIPLYENEILYMEMIKFLNDKNFKLVSLENGFSDEITGHLLQVDGIFVQNP